VTTLGGTVPTEAELQELIDKQAIYEVLCRYCRGVDRLDKELVLSCFHPDTPDTHLGLGGKLYTGTIEEYLDGEFPKFRDTIAGVMHYIMNFLCEVEGDQAVAETYQLSTTWGKDPTDPRVNMQNSNRYIDRFERRNGEWRIAERQLLRNYTYIETRPSEFPDVINGWPKSARDRTDPAYRTVRDFAVKPEGRNQA
jgi:hypothetical protein